ncbi:MAG: biotin/lipoyl-containing protein [Bacillota bacterium]
MSKKFKITVDGNTYEVEVEEFETGANQSTQTTNPAGSSKERVEAPAPQKSTAKKTKKQPAATGGGAVEAPMAGKIIEIPVAEGEQVAQGDLIVILEAMKMENEIYAPAAGEVTEIMVKANDTVDSGDVLLTIE